MPRLLFFYAFWVITANVYSQTNTTLQRQREYEARHMTDAERERPRVLGDTKNYTDPKLFGTNLNKGPGSFVNLSNYPVSDFSPHLALSDSLIPAPIATIKMIDARFDIEKVSFLPVNTDIQKKGYPVMGLQIFPSLSGWLKESFAENYFTTDSNSKRELLIVIKKCWFGNSANQLYSFSKQALVINLHYAFDIYTSLPIGYYPQKMIKGVLSAYYNKGDAYTVLTDSLLYILKKELTHQDFTIKETELNWQSPVNFNDYYNSRIKKALGGEKIRKGVYESFADFLDRKVISDSVDITQKYNNNETVPMYACQLSAFKEGVHVPVNQSWGYFDGSSLFLNTGNGFFVKLIRSKDNYVFINLKNIQQDPVKKYFLNGMQIGESNYLLLKDYTKAYALTFQLDMDTGKLY